MNNHAANEDVVASQIIIVLKGVEGLSEVEAMLRQKRGVSNIKGIQSP